MQFLAILVLSLLSYSSLLVAPQTINPDGDIIRRFFFELHGLSDYISKMLALKTIDLQPLRDLSFYVDFRIYEVFGFNTNIWQNVLWWAIACYVLLEILKQEFPDRPRSVLFVLVLCFTVWPLFSNAVSWGMGRKHIMCFCFILLSTLELRRKNYHYANLGYLLSVLSQPIAVLWPLWALCLEKRNYKKLWPSLLIMVGAIAANTWYYSRSALIIELFHNKFKDFSLWGHKFQVLGRYFFNIFFPFKLSMSYIVDPTFMWPGFIFLALVSAAYVMEKRSGRFFLTWISFSLFPLATIINTPSVALDVYLLIPAAGLFVLVIAIFGNLDLRSLWVALPVLGALTWFEAKHWKEPIPFYEKSYVNSPSCKTAFNLAGHYLLEGKTIPFEIWKFFSFTSCPELNVKNGLTANFFYGKHFRYDSRMPVEKKLEYLAILGKDHYYPAIARIALLAAIGREAQAINDLRASTYLFSHLDYNRDGWDDILRNDILPLCRKINHEICLATIGHLPEKKPGPNLM